LVAPRDGLANKLNAKNHDFSLFYPEDVFEQQAFSGDIQKCCVSFVDMVHSTEIIAQISDPARIRKYYSTFINTIAAIVRRFNAKIIKNTGDCLIYYFPQTFDYSNSYAFKDVIECGLTMIEAHSYINKASNKDKLPEINYRISADYGNVQMSRSISSTTNDLFGPVMNLCARMNSMASPNGMVIGINLHQIINRYYANDYVFEPLKGRSVIDTNETYHTYAVKNKNNNKSFNLLAHDIELLQKPSLSITGRQESKEQSRNILIVDDEPDALFTYKTFLTSEGFNVDAFTIPEEALDAFAKRVHSHYSLVIVDIRMPRLNGLQLYHQLKMMSMSVKVLFVSALDAAAELVSILPNSNEIRVIKKPADQEHFMSAVRALLVSTK
jgi:two-component system, OmpR family, response regulator ChvI